MLKSHLKKKRGNVTITNAPTIPLIDSIFSPPSGSTTQNASVNDSDIRLNGWDYEPEDWGTVTRSSHLLDQSTTIVQSRGHDSVTEIESNDQSIYENLKMSINHVDIIDLSKVVNKLIVGSEDQSAYETFLSMLQRYSVRSTRNDNLDESVYHLIQAGVSFIRSNGAKFDVSKLEECYRRRNLMKQIK